MAARERQPLPERVRIARTRAHILSAHVQTVPDRVQTLIKPTQTERIDAQFGAFSDFQIDLDSKLFLAEHHFQVTETERLGRHILHTTAETILAQQQELLAHPHPDLPSDLAAICTRLASSRRKIHQRAIEQLQGEQGENLIKALQERHDPSLQPTIDALIQTRLAYNITSSDTTKRKEAISQLHTAQGEALQQKLVEQTRENMDKILTDENGKRRSYTHEEIVFLMPDVLANIYVAAIATLGFVPHQEQLYGVMGILDGPGKRGTIIKEDTGEGKTFVAAASAILEALQNTGVHVVTSNDYLAEEGAKVAAKLASACGLRVGLILSTPPEQIEVVNGIEIQRQKISSASSSTLVATEQRRDAYIADITYGQKFEYESDANKDKLAIKQEQLRQVRMTTNEQGQTKIDTSWSFADAPGILDEVDRVLADLATQPSSIESPSTVGAFEEIHNVPYTQQQLRLLADIIAVRLGHDGLIKISEGRATVVENGGYDEVERILREEKIIEFLPNGATITKGPLLTNGETYFGGVIDENGHTQMVDTVEAVENQSSPPLASIFEHYLQQALQAEFIQVENGPYWLVRNSETMTVEVHVLNEDRRDEPLSRYQHGLHAALEAKHLRIEQEHHTGYTVTIRPETRILATTTTQLLWNSKKRLGGMSGTVNEQMPKNAPEQLNRPLAQEFWELYQDESHHGIRVVTIPRHLPSRRIDHTEFVGYRTQEESMQAQARFIGTFYGAGQNYHDLVEEFNTEESKTQRQGQQGRPFLLGYYSRESMEQMQAIIEQQEWFREYNAAHPDSPLTIRLLSAQEVHAILEASPEELEENIVQQAGHAHTITIANLAGRGTDVPLTQLARRLGGLYPVRGEPMDSIRQEKQFNGRGGRQDDEAETRGFASFDARLFTQVYGPEWVQSMQEILTETDHEQMQFVVNSLGAILTGNTEQLEALGLDFSDEELSHAQRGILIGLNNKFRPGQLLELQKLLERQAWFREYNDSHPESPFTIRILTEQETQQARSQPLSPESHATITIAGIPDSKDGLELDLIAENLGGAYAIFNGHTTVTKVSRYTEIQQHIWRVQARIANWSSTERYALQRDYAVIGEQLDRFYADRREVLFSESQDENVRRIARSYVRSLIIGDLQEQSGIFGPPEESDRSVSTQPMDEEKAIEFIDRLVEIIPLDDDQVERLFAYATSYEAPLGQRSLIDFATEIVMESYANMQEEIQETAQNMLATAPNLPENSEDIPPIDAQTYARRAILESYNTELSEYLTQIMDLREDIMHRAMLGEKQPESLFAIAAYELYRGFKPNLQATMLRTLFSRRSYTIFAAETLAPYLQEPAPVAPILTQPEEGITIFQTTSPAETHTITMMTNMQIPNPFSDEEESN